MNKYKKVVVLTGLKGSGKDEIAKVLIKEFGYKKIAFADLLKDIVALLYGWPREGLEGTTSKWREWRETEDKLWGITPRYALQKVGTELVRDQLHRDLWARRLVQKILVSKHQKFVITDCRFANEISIVKNSHFDVHFWRVERGNRPSWWERAEYENKSLYGLKTSPETQKVKIPTPIDWSGLKIHASERSWQGLDNPEVIIYNNQSLLELYSKVINFAVKYLGESKWKRFRFMLRYWDCLH